VGFCGRRKKVFGVVRNSMLHNEERGNVGERKRGGRFVYRLK
jgi:hypothetical protein